MTIPDSEETLSRSVGAERLASARSLVKNYVLAAAGIGLLPVPLLDLAGIMALQIKLVHGLALHYGVPFKNSVAQSLVASLLSGPSSFLLAKGLASLAKAVPVLGTLGGGGAVAVTSASVTYAVGEVFVMHFESGGSLLDIDRVKAKALFKRKLASGQTEAVAPATISAETPVEATAPASAEKAVAETLSHSAANSARASGGRKHIRPAGGEQLEDIVGIGEVYANRLRNAGVTRFAELSALPVERIKEIIGRGFPLSAESIQSWIKQADALASGIHPDTHVN